ncbi:hypothetical protein TSUD_407570, partial [Trifolium subterraneum]
EELLGESQTLLLTISLQAHSLDRWLWRPDVDGGYTVRGAYQILTAQDVVPLDAAIGLIWHPQVPLKVSILVWRLLRDRLPTKVNLSYRGILPVGDSLCVSGCGAVESAHFGDITDSIRSLYLIHDFRWYPSASFVYAAHMACMRVGCVDRAKSQVVQRLSKFFTSYVGQDQDFFF